MWALEALDFNTPIREAVGVSDRSAATDMLGLSK
jgi:hypothetical protein